MPSKIQCTSVILWDEGKKKVFKIDFVKMPGDV